MCTPIRAVESNTGIDVNAVAVGADVEDVDGDFVLRRSGSFSVVPSPAGFTHFGDPNSCPV